MKSVPVDVSWQAGMCRNFKEISLKGEIPLVFIVDEAMKLGESSKAIS